MKSSGHGGVLRDERPGRSGLGLLITWLWIPLTLPTGCGPAEPKAICTMKNPETGESVRLYREIWYKRQSGNDEKRHIELWRDEQRKAGFTIEVAP